MAECPDCGQELPPHMSHAGTCRVTFHIEPTPVSRAQIYAALAEAKAKVEDPREVVGNFGGKVPIAVGVWAEKNGLPVRDTTFAPPGRVFIMGAVPVVGVFPR